MRKIMLGSVLLISSLSYADNSQQSTNNRTISATGHADIQVPQSIANISFTISKKDNDVQDLQQYVRTNADSLIQKLKKNNLISIETLAINLVPEMSYKDGVSKATGYYTASYTIGVKSKITDVGKIIDTASGSNVTAMSSPQLLPSDTDTAKAHLEAIKQATLNAQTQATTALNSVGLKSTGFKQITVLQNSPTPQPRYDGRMAMAAMSANISTPVEAGVTTVSADVSVTLGY